MKIAILFFFTIIAFNIEVDSVSNGNFVRIEELPFIVSLTFYDSYTCGGAIISEFFVITAAHCIDNYEYENWDKIVTGRSVSVGREGSEYAIEKIYIPGGHADGEWNSIHEYYTEYDIALIKLKEPIKFNESQQPIKISSKAPKGGDTLTICGFGSMGTIKGHSPGLRMSEVTVIDREECRPYSKSVHVPNSLFCAGNGTTDVCEGDSGSPVILNREIVGIVSSGPDCAYNPTRVSSPGLYARVDLCFDWIMKVTGIKYL